MELPRSLKRRIRQTAGANTAMPLIVVEEDILPTVKGEGFHYETMGGQHITYPSAYGKVGWSNMRYITSTLRIEVGLDWIRQNMTEKEAVQIATEKLLQGKGTSCGC